MGNLLDAQAGKFPMDHKAIFTGSSNAGLTIDGIIAERATIYEDRGSTWYMQLSTVRDEIRAFWGPNKAVSAISVQMAHEYQNYLREKGNGPNTIAKKIKTLRGLVSQKIAAGEYQGLNPFALVKTSSVPVKKLKLTWEEVKAIEELKLVGVINDFRNLFLFSFYAQGMRFENCILLKKSDITAAGIRYQMNKGKKTREISINPKLQVIIDDYQGTDPSGYLFPFVKAGQGPQDPRRWKHEKDTINTMANAYLKRIAILAGIEKPITMHIARHTFAYLLKVHQSDTGQANIYVIQQALGHSDIKTTEMYLAALDDDQVNKAVSGMWK